MLEFAHERDRRETDMLTPYTAQQLAVPGTWTVVYQYPGGITEKRMGPEREMIRLMRYLIIDRYHVFLFDDNAELYRQSKPYYLR